jgi:hypothetical protein
MCSFPPPWLTKYVMVKQEGSTVLNNVKVKMNLSFAYAGNVCGVEHKPLLILNLSRQRLWIAIIMRHPIYTQGKSHRYKTNDRWLCGSQRRSRHFGQKTNLLPMPEVKPRFLGHPAWFWDNGMLPLSSWHTCFVFGRFLLLICTRLQVMPKSYSWMIDVFSFLAHIWIILQNRITQCSPTSCPFRKSKVSLLSVKSARRR